MSTLLTDQSVPIPPLSSLDSSCPEVMPYAITGATAEPPLGRETAGWVAGVIPPADQENWFRQAIWAWMGRTSCVSFFTQRSTVGIALGGTLVAGNVIRLSYNGINNDYIVTSADVIAGFDTVAANWAQQITLDNALRGTMDAQGSATGTMLVFYRTAGLQWPHTVTCSVVSGTTTVTATDIYGGSGAPLLVTSDLGGGDGLKLHHGGPIECGVGASATGTDAVAIGANCDVTAANGVALGDSNVVDQSSAAGLGKQSKPLNEGELAVAAGIFTAVGDAQTGTVVAKAIAFGTSSTTVMVPNGQVCTLNLPALGTGKVYALQIDIVARWEGGTGGGSSNADQAYWSLTGCAFVDSTGAVSLSGLGGVTAPTQSQGHGNSYAVNVSGLTNEQLNITPTTNHAAVYARFVASIRYTVV